jgi:hypothetical protein
VVVGHFKQVENDDNKKTYHKQLCGSLTSICAGCKEREIAVQILNKKTSSKVVNNIISKIAALWKLFPLFLLFKEER